MRRGYKVFHGDWTCRGFQYTCPGMFEMKGDPAICCRGFHFCEKAIDCFDYYSFDSNNKVAEVIAFGLVVKKGNKSCTNKIKIVREIPWTELLDIVNGGSECTGMGNTGSHNEGDYNTGDFNVSSFNTGCFMTKNSSKIYMFNKASEWTFEDWRNSPAYCLLNTMPEENITDKQLWWDCLKENEKNIIRNIPNFDVKIFYECTGIKI